MYSLLRGTYRLNATEKVIDDINLTAYKVVDDAVNTSLDLAAKREISELFEAI
jgi:hypothetical protein